MRVDGGEVNYSTIVLFPPSTETFCLERENATEIHFQFCFQNTLHFVFEMNAQQETNHLSATPLTGNKYQPMKIFVNTVEYCAWFSSGFHWACCVAL